MAAYAHPFYTFVVTAGGPSVWKRGVIFKVRLSPQSHLFSQYYELYIHQCTYLDVRDYTEVNLIDMCWFGILQVGPTACICRCKSTTVVNNRIMQVKKA